MPVRGGRAPGSTATASVSRKKDPIVTIGDVPTSLATSTDVLSKSAEHRLNVFLVSTSALVVRADLRYRFER